MLTSLAVTLGLATVWLGLTLLDPVLALLVAIIVLWAGVRILLSSIDSLMNASLPQEESHRVHGLMVRYNGSARLEHMRTRKAGTQRYFDITLTTCQHLTAGPLTWAETNTGQERSLPGNARV